MAGRSRKTHRSPEAADSKAPAVTDDADRGSPGSRRCNEPDPSAPLWLLRSPIYRRLPLKDRAALDQAILVRPDQCGTLGQIAARFNLAAHGISLSSLRTYARKLESLVRPEITAQVLAGVLGCLPRQYRRKVVAGSQVMLLSRVLGALDSKADGLSVAELAKLASVLASMAGRGRRSGVSKSGTKTAVASPSGKGADAAPPADASLDPTAMARSVRLLYGLSWPPSECADEKKAS